jgi:hypothetical protein
VVLQAPNNLPLDVLPADGCVAMAASVPAAADVGDVGIAKQTVLATAQHLQVNGCLCALLGMWRVNVLALLHVPMLCGGYSGDHILNSHRCCQACLACA